MANEQLSEFLPEVLAIQKTPPSPAGRLLLWTIIALFGFSFAWAWFGRVDIVAVAPGKIIPAGHVKPVQAPQAAVVEALDVADGTRVAAGERLMKLDDTVLRHDLAGRRRERDALVADTARLQQLIAVVDALREGGYRDARAPSPALPGVAGAPQGSKALQDARLREQLADLFASLATLRAQAAEKRAQRLGIQRRLAQLDAIVPLVAERAEALARLLAKKMAPRVQWLEVEETRVTRTRERDVQASRLDVIEIELWDVEQKRRQLLAHYEAEWLAELIATRERLAVLVEEIEKLEYRVARLEIRAPVGGTVQELSVHSAGAVVTPAQGLLKIVPDPAVMEVQAWIANRDIGFVEPGQPAEIKVDTFPYTKYGTVPAVLHNISRDAVDDDARGLVYAVQVVMDRAALLVDGVWTSLTPGMAVSVELHLGKRRIIEFLLSPLLRAGSESLRER